MMARFFQIVRHLIWDCVGVYFLLSLIATATDSGGEKTGSADKEKTFIYSPVGKRDPFKAPLSEASARIIAVESLSPLERFSVEQLSLKAILRGDKLKAMFEDPEGKTHIITEGDVLGRERATVSRILRTAVILTERTYNYLGVESLYEKVISLPEK